MSRRGNAADDLLSLAGMRPKRDSTSLLSTAELDPSHVMEVGTGFWPSKTLLSAVELDLFSVLGAEAAAFLDEQSPTYVGGFLELCNARLYGVWGELTEALKTGEPQSEVKLKPFFEEIYSDPAKLEQFMQAMSGLSRFDFDTLAERFDFGCYGTVCDVGGATGRLSMTLAGRYPFTEALPRADVITMSHILHDWNLDRKRQLISAAYDALPDGGAFIVVEHLIDDARRDNVFGLMMSLTMLLTFGDAFDFTGSDFAGWCREAGFGDIEIVPLTGLTSAGIAYK
jgi:hypothetical protein